jgi:hypothetical protein
VRRGDGDQGRWCGRREEEGVGHVRDRLHQARGGQDHGHRLAREVPAGAHQGRRRQGREPRRLHHRLSREDQGHRHLRGALLQEVRASHPRAPFTSTSYMPWCSYLDAPPVREVVNTCGVDLRICYMMMRVHRASMLVLIGIAHFAILQTRWKQFFL